MSIGGRLQLLTTPTNLCYTAKTLISDSQDHGVDPQPRKPIWTLRALPFLPLMKMRGIVKDGFGMSSASCQCLWLSRRLDFSLESWVLVSMPVALFHLSIGAVIDLYLRPTRIAYSSLSPLSAILDFKCLDDRCESTHWGCSGHQHHQRSSLAHTTVHWEHKSWVTSQL